LIRQLKGKEILRIEGHGELVVKISEEGIEKVEFRVLEPSRLFEAFMVNKPAKEAPYICSRICGLCGYSHAMCSAKAIENALNMEVPEEASALREAIMMLSTADSHLLHVFALSLPDFIKVKTFIEAASKLPRQFKEAFEIKNAICRTLARICGSSIHPVNVVPGGFTSKIERKTLIEISRELEREASKAKQLAEEVIALLLPKEQLERKGDYGALSGYNYPFYIGESAVIGGEEIPAPKFKENVREIEVDYSTSKKALFKGKNYMVGALARLNTHYSQLSENAREIADQLELKIPTTNPYLIPAAQLIEVVNCLEKASETMEKLPPIKPAEKLSEKSGMGSAIVEAPRGLLYHEYRIESGKLAEADIITPTVQNIPDMEEAVKQVAEKFINCSLNSIKEKCEAVLRCYDPCLSCSTHVIKLK